MSDYSAYPGWEDPDIVINRELHRRAAEGVDGETQSILWMKDVDEEQVSWTWKGYLPDGKVVILDGDPGLGKSVVWSDLTARISTGDRMPNGQPLPRPENCLVISAEDDLADTIKPRLRAAGADMNRVATLALRKDGEGTTIPFSVPDDMPRLRSAIQQTRARFVVIDPVMAFISDGIQTHNDASVRRALTPLTELAQEKRCVIVLIRHLNKDTRSNNALHRGGGSIGISGAGRTVLLLAPDPNESGDLVLAVVKANLSRGRAPSISLRVEPWEEDRDLPRVRWAGAIDLRADDLLHVPDARRNSPEREEAERFLRDVLADGPMKARDVEAEAKDAGITKSTLGRASLVVGVKKERERGESGVTAVWIWSLP